MREFPLACCGISASYLGQVKGDFMKPTGLHVVFGDTFNKTIPGKDGAADRVFAMQGAYLVFPARGNVPDLRVPFSVFVPDDGPYPPMVPYEFTFQHFRVDKYDNLEFNGRAVFLPLVDDLKGK